LHAPGDDAVHERSHGSAGSGSVSVTRSLSEPTHLTSRTTASDSITEESPASASRGRHPMGSIQWAVSNGLIGEGSSFYLESHSTGKRPAKTHEDL